MSIAEPDPGPAQTGPEPVSLERVAVVGTGLIGTSVALALAARGVATYLIDADPAVAAVAADLGAGLAAVPDEPVDLAVIAVPPAQVAAVLLEQQRRRLATAFTDVASVKAGPQREMVALGADCSTFVGGHPLAGRERSGPTAARADLFEGRPWVLTPSEQSSVVTLARARALTALCGARPVLMDADEHDEAVALVSHAPHIVASLMAARLAGADEEAVRLSGQGVRDVTRVAAGDVALWTDILLANAAAVTGVLEALSLDLRSTLAALRENGAAGEGLAEVLRQGNLGCARIPGKQGLPTVPYALVPLVVPDRPGALAAVFAAAGQAEVNIEDVTIEHSPGQPVGLVELAVRPEAAGRLVTALRAGGWIVYG